MTAAVARTTVQMPPLGEGAEECTVTRWLKRPADEVEVGEPLLEVATDKDETAIPHRGDAIDWMVPRRGSDARQRQTDVSMAFPSISYDHRVVDGADAARSLTAIKNRIETGFTPSDLT